MLTRDRYIVVETWIIILLCVPLLSGQPQQPTQPTPPKVAVSHVSGSASFQKAIPSPDGLLDRKSELKVYPARGVLVDLALKSDDSILGTAATDNLGTFDISVNIQSATDVYLVVRAQEASSGEKVTAPTSGEILAVASAPFRIDPGAKVTRTIIALYENGGAGAFNILDVLNRGREYIAKATPAPVPPVPVLWEPDGIQGSVFNPETNTLSIHGSENDPDEFDDSIILHEFAHYIAKVFSIDQSRGGRHLIFQGVDPRLAWSEGWATFFSSAVRDNAIYIDTKGSKSANFISLDDRPSLDGVEQPYANERVVSSVLWSIYHKRQPSSAKLALELGFPPIWQNFSGPFKGVSFAYLVSFADTMVSALQQTVQPSLFQVLESYSIHYSPTSPSHVDVPFPAELPLGRFVSNEIDSVTACQSTVERASRFYSFTVVPQQPIQTIRLDVTGSKTPPTSRLLVCLSEISNGMEKAIACSSPTAVGSRAEITKTLESGIYLVEVRSWFGLPASQQSCPDTCGCQDENRTTFNSGAFNLLRSQSAIQ